MKTLRNGIRNIIITIFSILLLISFAVAGDNDNVQSVTVTVDGLSCPFCAYGLEKKRVNEIASVEKSTIDLNKRTVVLIPLKGQHIEIDEVKDAITNGGFTPKEVYVELVGILFNWNNRSALLIKTFNQDKQYVKVSYFLEENDQLKKLKESVKSKTQKILIKGIAIQEMSDQHSNHPYSITIESFQVL